MRLVSFGSAGHERPGAMLADDRIVDLQAASGGRLTSVRQLLAAGDAGLAEVRGWLASPRAEWVRAVGSERLGPPVTDPGKIACMGRNYKEHADEQGAQLPAQPMLFSKAATALCGHGDPIWYPVDEEHVDYEVELAVVIGKPAFRIDAADWREYVAGYTVLNDVSARDTQRGDKQWFRGKSFDSFCPLGPWLVTRDEIADPHALRVTTHLNGEVRQDSTTSLLIFPIPYILAFATRNITFLPGDVIATGTPAGVGMFRDPPACMKVGDEVSVSVQGIGTLTNRVTARP